MPNRGLGFSREATPGGLAAHSPTLRASAENAKGDWSATPCVSIWTSRGVSTRIDVRPLPLAAQEYWTVASRPVSEITKREQTLLGCRSCSSTFASDMQKLRLASGLSRDRISHWPGWSSVNALIGRAAGAGAAKPVSAIGNASVPMAIAATSQYFAFNLRPPAFCFKASSRSYVPNMDTYWKNTTGYMTVA